MAARSPKILAATTAILLANVTFVACSPAEEAGAKGSPVARQTAASAVRTLPEPVEKPAFNAYLDAPPAEAASTGLVLRSADGRSMGRVAHVDPQRHVPTFVWAERRPPPRTLVPLTHGAAALYHLRQFAAAYRLSAGDLDGLAPAKVHNLGRGAVVVTFQQSTGGLEIYGQSVKVTMTQSQELVSLSGTLFAGATRSDAALSDSFVVSADAAVASALSDLYDIHVDEAELRPTASDAAGYQRFELVTADFRVGDAGYRFRSPARARRAVFPMPTELLPAYLLEVDAAPIGAEHSEMYRYVVSAVDGRVLERVSLTHYEAFQYRVWADEGDLRPMDGPIADNATPHPSGVADDFIPAYVAPRLLTVEGFNTNPEGEADPWLPAGATVTSGNNINAYADHETPNGFGAGDLRPQVSAPGVFDYTYDPLVSPFDSDEQISAAVVQLFFTNNWMHDYWYDSGFDEAAGNAQLDNYGRGGVQGDALLAEGQDTRGIARNNANMSTPSDGASPRMQMYTFDNRRFTEVGTSGLSIASPAATAGNYAAERAPFLGTPASRTISGPIVLATNNAGAATACGTITADVAGAIALVDVGTCNFTSKAINAQAAGAVAVVLANTAPTGIVAGGSNGSVTIPLIGISQADGALIRSDLNGSNATITTSEIAFDGPALLDGTIDNHIIEHEWGHYFHNRLVQVGSIQTAGQGEGWGDCMAMMGTLREGDDLDGTYAMAPYAVADAYAGIRRFPYSTDMTKNGLTFRMIGNGEALPDGIPGTNNFQVHNVGEVWCQMVFDSYVGLLRESQASPPRYTFAEAERRMADYIVAGMKAAPFAPTFTEQRDGILAAAAASDVQDFTIIAQAFARRGAGSGAVSPPRDSQDGTGVVESFEVAGALDALELAIEESGENSCDNDGVIDPGESGLVRIRVVNNGAAALSGTSATISTTIAGVSFPAGPTVAIAELVPYQALEIEFVVDLAEDVDAEVLDFSVTVTNPAAINESVGQTGLIRANFDYLPESTRLDTVEAPDGALVYSIDSVNAVGPFRQTLVEATGNTVWFVPDNATLSDERLGLPPLNVDADEDFVVAFDHRFSFEGDPAAELWDGGVLELSRDDGETWADVSEFGVDPGYVGPITVPQAQNPLVGREVWSGESPGYAEGEFVSVELDFGHDFAGETVRLRFRMGTDVAVGAPGWEIDNLQVWGTTNAPFTDVVPDAGVCVDNSAPVADAGENQTAVSGSGVTLDGSASTDADGDPLRYHWTQIAGPTVVLSATEGATPGFTAPSVTSDETLVFTLVVNDENVDSEADEVSVLVSEGDDSGSGSGTEGDDGGDGEADGGSGGCGCAAGTSRGEGLLGLLGLGFVALVGRRRRRRTSSARDGQG